MQDPVKHEDPLALFGSWLEEAKEKEINDPTAAALATVDDGGLPDVRMVLMKDFGPGGFVFYTNYASAKGRQLLAQPKAALLFHWKSLRRQVRVRGDVSQTSDQEADGYFASRPRHSQLGAWASDQSRPLSGRLDLEKRVVEYGLKFGVAPVPRPAHWSGFRPYADAYGVLEGRSFSAARPMGFPAKRPLRGLAGGSALSLSVAIFCETDAGRDGRAPARQGGRSRSRQVLPLPRCNRPKRCGPGGVKGSSTARAPAGPCAGTGRSPTGRFAPVRVDRGLIGG